MPPLPLRGRIEERTAFHGFRSARQDAGCAPPVATARRPVGAKIRVGEDSPGEPGKKCRLPIDHVAPISQGGTDDERNLLVICVYYYKGKAADLDVAIPHCV